MDKCDIGKLLNVECHKTTKSRVVGFEIFNELVDSEQEEILWRACLRDQSERIVSICKHHYMFYTQTFKNNAKHCCSILTKHKKKVSGNLCHVSYFEKQPYFIFLCFEVLVSFNLFICYHSSFVIKFLIYYSLIYVPGHAVISLEKAKQLEAKGKAVIPGQKFCSSCNKKASNILEENEIDKTDKGYIPDIPVPSSSKATLNNSLTALEESPIKLHGIALHQREKKAKAKLEKVVEKIETKVAETYNVEIKKETLYSKDTLTKAADLDKLTTQMKEKIRVSDYNMQIKILTLTPESWTKEYTTNYFNVTDYQVRKARKLKKENGILSDTGKKIGKKLPIETIEKVISFYEDDEVSRIMPGKKDFLSVGKGQN